MSVEDATAVLAKTGLTKAQALEILSARGVEGAELKLAAATLEESGANVTATATTKSLSTATASFGARLKGLLATIKAHPIIAIITAITALVSIINRAKEKVEQAREEANQKAQETVDKNKEEQSSLNDLISKYKELANQDMSKISTRQGIKEVQDEITKLVGKQADNLDLLWTIQHKEAYLNMLQTGVLRANSRHLFCEDDFLSAYDWMSHQMRTRICVPPNGVQYPVWLWHTWEGKRSRPNMRSFDYAPTGTPIVLLTVNVPDEKVLLSDFDCWHAVLNGVYLAENEVDDRPHSPEEVCESWNRIFDVSSVNPYYSSSLSIQATVWEVHKEWVKKAEFFTAK